MMTKIPANQNCKQPQYVLCVRNEGVPASLEIRKLYELAEDGGPGAEGMLRVIDESGEDYLFPSEWFIRIDLSSEVRSALQAA